MGRNPTHFVKTILYVLCSLLYPPLLLLLPPPGGRAVVSPSFRNGPAGWAPVPLRLHHAVAVCPLSMICLGACGVCVRVWRRLGLAPRVCHWRCACWPWGGVKRRVVSASGDAARASLIHVSRQDFGGCFTGRCAAAPSELSRTVVHLDLSLSVLAFAPFPLGFC